LERHTKRVQDPSPQSQQQKKKKTKKRKMVRFFAERKTKATRTDAARGFPTFAHRSQNGGAADSPREDLFY
tara:strand:+ start:133 stop:345 length:213 start_codon:yes stop_codon:yes gene_type:complete